MAINIGLLLVAIAPDAAGMRNNIGMYPNSTLTSFDPANPSFNQNLADTENINSLNSSKYNTGGYNSKDLWSVFISPMEGNNSRIILYIVAFALLIGALGFIPFVNRSDLSVLSGPFIILIGVGAPTCISTYGFINNQVSQFACSVPSGCFISNIFAAMIGGTLMIAWIFASLEWWTGRPSS